MVTVGAFAAKTHLSRLLERVAGGEEVIITKHGKPVARLVPAMAADQAKVNRVIAELKALRAGCTLGGLTWKDLATRGVGDGLRPRLFDRHRMVFRRRSLYRDRCVCLSVSAMTAIVPGLWHLELGNVLLQAERRGRLNPAETSARLALILALPISTDHETSLRALREVLSAARAEKLATYDAAYLELAMRRGLPLATKDRALDAAAQRAGVQILPG